MIAVAVIAAILAGEVALRLLERRARRVRLSDLGNALATLRGERGVR